MRRMLAIEIYRWLISDCNGRDGCVGVNNYWSTIQFAAMYYLKVAASPVFFERYKQCLHTLLIALLILNNDFGRIFGNR